MAEPFINWQKLVPYDRDQYRSFEELCYQIATTLYEQEGRFTSIDDSGGGDGVEFYLTFTNGEQWGWQAKFYYPDGRLSASRRASIKQSLQKACERHPNLTRWYLCTPRNLTPDEQKWYDEELATTKLDGRAVVPAGHPVEIDNWTESDFVGWMSEDRLAGIRLNFFGELELTREWFTRQFEKQLEGVGEKFDSLLHTETYVDEQIHQLLGDDSLAGLLGEWLSALNEAYKAHRDSAAALQQPEPRSLNWENATASLLPVATELTHSLNDALSALEWARGQLEARYWQSVRAHNWESHLCRMDQAYDDYGRVAASINVDELEYLRKEADGEQVNNERQARRTAQQTLQSPSSFAANFMDRFRGAVERLKGLRDSELHAFGDAGFGKTHLCCHVCQERLESGLPALLVLGKHFTTEQPLEQQLLSILDIPSTYSWNNFLRALESVARAYRTRIPVIFDGLNEATVGGVFSGVWQRGLPGLCQEVSHYESVALITTCRSSYRREIWGEKGPQNSAYVRGFDP